MDPVRSAAVSVVFFVLWGYRSQIVAYAKGLVPTKTPTVPPGTSGYLARSSALLAELTDIALAEGNQTLALEITQLWPKFLPKAE